MRAHPLLLVTPGLKDALLALTPVTGFTLVRAGARPSAFFERHSPSRRLPTFWSVEVNGRPGVDDLGIDAAGSLIASARVVEAMGAFSLKHATLTQYAPARSEEGRGRPLVSS